CCWLGSRSSLSPLRIWPYPWRCWASVAQSFCGCLPHLRAARKDANSDFLLLTYSSRPSSRFPTEIGHGVVQHAEDDRPVFAREPLLKRSKPASHRLERWTDGLGCDDAFDADWRGRLFACEQDFL